MNGAVRRAGAPVPGRIACPVLTAWQVVLAALQVPERPEAGRGGCWEGGLDGVALPPDLRSRRALRAFAAAVLETREAFEGNEALFRLRAAELDGDDMRAGQCLGQARAYKNAAGLVGDAVGAATGRWDGDGADERRGRERDGVKGRAAKLAGELAALGMAAQVTGRSVRAWVPGQEGCAVAVTVVWMRDGRRLPRRVWWWHHGNSYGERRRADTQGAAVGVAALLLRLAGEPGEPGGSQ